MIARVWSAHTTSTQAPIYANHLRDQVLPTLKHLEGFVKAMLLQREASGSIEIIVITLWQSLDSIKGFAGADLERAVVSDEAAAVLTEFDARVRHYDIVVNEDASESQVGVQANL